MDLLAVLEQSSFSTVAKELVLWDGMPGSLFRLSLPTWGKRASHLLPITAAAAAAPAPGSGLTRRCRTLPGMCNSCGQHVSVRVSLMTRSDNT